MHIRRATLYREADACARLMSESEPWITLRRDYEDSLWLMRYYKHELYIAVEGEGKEEAVRGFVLLVMNGTFVGYMQSVCVAPDARGQGLGTRLIAFAEQRIFRDAPNVFVCVSSFNPGARRLYERLGYETIGELKDYIVAGHSEFLLRKSIAPLTGFQRLKTIEQNKQ